MVNKCKEEASKVPHYARHCMVLKRETWQSKSETFGKYRKVVLEKNGEDQLDRSCKKKKYYIERRRREIRTIKVRQATYIGHSLCMN